MRQATANGLRAAQDFGAGSWWPEPYNLDGGLIQVIAIDGALGLLLFGVVTLLTGAPVTFSEFCREGVSNS